MKDAAAKIADKMCETEYSGEPAWSRATIARDIRSAIRRAVKAERERCVVAVDSEFVAAMTERRGVNRINIFTAINTPAKKRPSRRK